MRPMLSPHTKLGVTVQHTKHQSSVRVLCITAGLPLQTRIMGSVDMPSYPILLSTKSYSYVHLNRPSRKCELNRVRCCGLKYYDVALYRLKSSLVFQSVSIIHIAASTTRTAAHIDCSPITKMASSLTINNRNGLIHKPANFPGPHSQLGLQRCHPSERQKHTRRQTLGASIFLSIVRHITTGESLWYPPLSRRRRIALLMAIIS